MSAIEQRLAAPTIEQRLAALESLLAPRAATPPITIGELTNVPAPGSAIAAQWAQDISSRVVQRFTTTAALKAWTAPTGAFAVALDTGIVWRRAAGGGWAQFTPWTGHAAGVALNGVQSGVASTLQIPADIGARIATVSACLQVDVFYDREVTVGMTVAGTSVAEANVPRTTIITASQVNRANITLVASNILLPVSTVVQVTVAIVVAPTPGAGTYATFAGPVRNRVDAIVTPRGS